MREYVRIIRRNQQTVLPAVEALPTQTSEFDEIPLMLKSLHAPDYPKPRKLWYFSIRSQAGLIASTPVQLLSLEFGFTGSDV